MSEIDNAIKECDLMIDRIIEKHNPTVAGLDTRVEHLPEEFIAELGMLSSLR